MIRLRVPRMLRSIRHISFAVGLLVLGTMPFPPASEDAGSLALSCRPAWGAPASADAMHPDLFQYDASQPLEIQEKAVRTRGRITEHDISFTGPKGGKVTAFLLVPEGQGPFAGMIFMHGATGSRRSLLPGARRFCEAGAVCLLLDGPYNGDRAVPGKHLADIKRPEQMRDGIIQMVVELRRGIDLLVARPDVDPKRLGFVGSSLGGSVGAVLAGVDRRIAAYALMTAAGSWLDSALKSQHPLVRMARVFLTRKDIEQAAAVLAPVDPIHYVRHAGPSAILFQNGHKDTTVPVESAQAFQDAGSQPKTCKWYDAGHDLDIQAFVDRAEWFREKIGIGPVVVPERLHGLNH